MASTGEKQVSSKKYGRFGNENLIVRGNYYMMHASVLSISASTYTYNMYLLGNKYNWDHNF